MRCQTTSRYLGCAVLLAVLSALTPAWAQQPDDRDRVGRELRALAWQQGPTEGRIGSTATIKVAEGQAFLDAPNTKRFLELNQNPPRENHYTLAAPASGWFAIFSFEDSGFVKDDEKLDADALLKSIQESDKAGNEERKRLNMSALHVVGWHVPPHYDAGTKRLEWGLRLQGDSGGPVVNYTIRILGRRGVMHVTLVSEPATLDRDIAQFKGNLAAYSFTPGERYSEFRSGDRVAEYGLAALVLGGAAVVATKTGFLKVVGKFLIFGLIAFGGAVAAFFRKYFRKR